jgi:tRNA modification GTPase
MHNRRIENDTIAAISTPLGIGGLAIIRLSGKKSIVIADKVFKAKDGKSLNKRKSHRIIYGYVIDKNNSFKHLDEVLLSLMRAPKTYTKEDVIEFSCHGGLTSARSILELLIKNGARLAQPGEFTKRAFINGRIDLTQAEAVCDIINAKTNKSLDLALRHLKGDFAYLIKNIADIIADLISDIEAAIDFEVQNIKTLRKQQLKSSLNKIIKKISKILKEADYGIVLNEGINVVICGKANAGKSSLMNAFLKTEKVIVSPIAGTTRDTIEEIVNIKGVALRLIDTAGMLKTSGILESKAMSKTLESLKRADLALIILDASRKISEDDKKILKLLADKPHIVALNKVDLKNKINLDSIKGYLGGKPIIKISATKAQNLSKLEDAILQTVFDGSIKSVNNYMISNLRQKKLVEEAYKALKRAEKTLSSNLSYEFIIIDLREALGSLQEIIGEQVSIDILDKIFSKFCIGK